MWCLFFLVRPVRMNPWYVGVKVTVRQRWKLPSHVRWGSRCRDGRTRTVAQSPTPPMPLENPQNRASSRSSTSFSTEAVSPNGRLFSGAVDVLLVDEQRVTCTPLAHTYGGVSFCCVVKSRVRKRLRCALFFCLLGVLGLCCVCSRLASDTRPVVRLRAPAHQTHFFDYCVPGRHASMWTTRKHIERSDKRLHVNLTCRADTRHHAPHHDNALSDPK